MNSLDFNTAYILEIIVEIIVFLALMGVGIFVMKKLKGSDNKFLSPKEYLPDEEIHSIKQVYYLLMMSLCFFVVIYILVFTNYDLLYVTVFDTLFSLYIAITFENSKWRKLLVLMLIPYGSLTYILFGYTLVSLLDLIHIPVFLYFIKYYYDRFKKYTETNSLGITIVLLFLIVFVSFFITLFVENANPLDALVMVSNAFTSNGYAVLGNSIPGKLNSVLLVWGGYILSSVGTATLTAALLINHYNKRFDKLEELIKKNNDE